MTPKEELMLIMDNLNSLGQSVREELEAQCPDIFFWYKLEPDQIEAYLTVCRKIWAKWHTTEKFKVGDKVYVHPGRHSIYKNCIRATITEINNDGYGYRLRAFEQDLPGIYMFNIWDKDLSPRTNKSHKRLE